MDVSIVIVNWNSRHFLGACIRSIERHTSGIDYEVVVIDSGSFDGCDELLRREFPQVRFVQSPVNLGFAGANNRAYAYTTGRFILFLNPDTELTSPAVNLMVEHLQRSPRCGAVGCTLLNGDGSVQTSCIQSFPTVLNQLLSCEWLRRRFPASRLWGMSALYDSPREPVEVEVVSGACLMVNRNAFEQAGRFCEDYFMYADDVDLCHQLRQAGYSNHYLPQATVRHYGGGSTDSAPSEFSVVMMRDSIWQFLRKTRGPAYGRAYRLSILVAAVARLALMLPLSPLRAYPIRKWVAILAWSLGMRRPSRPARALC